MTLKEFLQTDDVVTALSGLTGAAKFTAAKTLANSHTETVYKPISALRSMDWTRKTGVAKKIEDAIVGANKDEVVKLINGFETTISELCKLFLENMSASNSQGFHTDPNDPDGEKNRAAAQALGEDGLGILTNKEISEYLALGEKEVEPYKNATLYDIQLALDECETVEITPSKGFFTIEVSEETELHNPQVLAELPSGDLVRVNNFRDVSTAKKYSCLVPREYMQASNFYVHDAYGAITNVTE